MALVKWDPFRDVEKLQNRINRMFEDSFGRSCDLDDEMSLCAWRPAVDIFKTENGIALSAELPGVSKENVSVEVKENILTLKGERLANQKIKEENYYRRERSYGKFQRAFTLPADVDSDKIKAEFKDGLLKIEVPKPEEHKPKTVTIH